MVTWTRTAPGGLLTWQSTQTWNVPQTCLTTALPTSRGTKLVQSSFVGLPRWCHEWWKRQQSVAATGGWYQLCVKTLHWCERGLNDLAKWDTATGNEAIDSTTNFGLQADKVLFVNVKLPTAFFRFLQLLPHEQVAFKVMQQKSVTGTKLQDMLRDHFLYFHMI